MIANIAPETAEVPYRPALLPVVALLAVGLLAASIGAPLLKPVFIAGCLVAGWWTWARDPNAHLSGVLLLVAFTPLLRRVLDDATAYDPAGLILVGPLVAMCPPILDLARGRLRVEGERLFFHAVVGLSILWAIFLTLVQGEWSSAVVNGIKWGVPLGYGATLLAYVQVPASEAQRTERRDGLLLAATRAFAVVLPAIGAYGIWQYIDPPSWDRFWLLMAPITSAGLPEPFEVRTFATMSGPAVFATFTAMGAFLVVLLHRSWLAKLLLLPTGIALLLSLYRTAWLMLLTALIVSALCSATRRKSLLLLLGGVLAGAAALLGPFQDRILERLQTLGDAQDVSGVERLYQYVQMWDLPYSGLIGYGYSSVDTGVAGAMAVDGMIISCWFSMGIVVGLFCLAALVGVVVQAMLTLRTDRSPVAIALAALAAGMLVQVPLASVASGELGLLFWLVCSLAHPVKREAPA